MLSSRERGGKIVGRRRAIMVLPDPGGPTISKWWNPAAAISAALFTVCWPFTSAKSSKISFVFLAKRVWMSIWVGAINFLLFSLSSCKKASVSLILETPITSIFWTAAPSAAFSFGSMQQEIPCFLASLTIGSAPFTGFTSPFSPSSPIISVFAAFSGGRCCSAVKIPTATGRSSSEPSFLKSAGERLTLIHIDGNGIPAFFSATFTRSLASFTSEFGSPTIWKQGSPLDTSTSTWINWLLMPWIVPDVIEANNNFSSFSSKIRQFLPVSIFQSHLLLNCSVSCYKSSWMLRRYAGINMLILFQPYN